MVGSTDSAQARSTLVTVVAWIFIVLAGMSTLVSLLQTVMVQLAPFDAMAHADGPEDMPAMFRFMFRHFRLFMAAFLVLSALGLASAIGLLRRQNWARLVFVGLLALGIAWNLGGMALQYAMFSSMQPTVARVPSDVQRDFDMMMMFMQVVSALMALALSLLFGWLIRRLLSAPVRAEFAQAR